LPFFNFIIKIQHPEHFYLKTILLHLGVRAGYTLYLFFKKKEKDAASIPNATTTI